eukprot:jgi/Ulvmu1/12730/UM095_0034.1
MTTMRRRNVFMLVLLSVLLAIPPAWTQEECEEATQQLKQCIEERRQDSKKHALCEENIGDLRGSIRKLESNLRNQSVLCEDAALKRQAQCKSETDKISLKLEAAELELKDGKSRISALADKLHDVSARADQLFAERTQCEADAIQKHSECEANAAEMQEKLRTSDTALRDSKRQASSASAIREEARLLTRQLDEERNSCQTMSSQLKEECDGRVQEVQQKMQAAAAECASATSDIDTLTVAVQSCQAALGEESEARKQANAQAALHESLHAKVSSELKQTEEQLAEQNCGLQKEVTKLKSELTKLGRQLHTAKRAYLPLWSIPYYDEAVKRAAVAKDQALLYYDQEIATGKAYQNSKDAVFQASERLQTMIEPHVSKAKVAMEPMFAKIRVHLGPVLENIKSQLQREQYKKVVVVLSDAQGLLLRAWSTARLAVADVYNSDVMNEARKDFTRMYMLLLGANVSGSGIDAAIPAMLAQYTLLAIPIMLLLPVVFMCYATARKPEETQQNHVKPKAQVASSKAGDSKRSKRR